MCFYTQNGIPQEGSSFSLWSVWPHGQCAPGEVNYEVGPWLVDSSLCSAPSQTFEQPETNAIYEYFTFFYKQNAILYLVRKRNWYNLWAFAAHTSPCVRFHDSGTLPEKKGTKIYIFIYSVHHCAVASLAGYQDTPNNLEVFLSVFINIYIFFISNVYNCIQMSVWSWTGEFIPVTTVYTKIWIMKTCVKCLTSCKSG